MASLPIGIHRHYASIKTLIDFDMQGNLTNLHFTMLLLKPTDPLSSLASTEIFTFHYASIKTETDFHAVD